MYHRRETLNLNSRKHLTYLSRMEFPILVNWISLCPFKGLLGGIYQLYSNFKRRFNKQTEENLIRRSDLVLHCLPMSHKQDARLIWVNQSIHVTLLQRILFFVLSKNTLGISYQAAFSKHHNESVSFESKNGEITNKLSFIYFGQ